MSEPQRPHHLVRRASGLWYFFLLAVTNLMWAGQGTAVKIIERPGRPDAHSLGPIAITFLPFYATTLLLVPVLLWQRRRNPQAARPSWSDWRQFAIAGICGQILAQLGMTWGTSRSLASNQAILNLLIPVMSAVLASVMLGERLTTLRIGSLVVGLAGVLLMSVKEVRETSFLEQSYLAGNLLILMGCFGSSFYNVYCKGLLARYGEVEILIFSYITASLASIPLLIWAEPLDPQALADLSVQGWLGLGFLAVFMYGASMLLFFYVLEHLPVTVASASLYLVPIFGVLLATSVLEEQLSPLLLFGAAIVLVSTVLVIRYDTPAD